MQIVKTYKLFKTAKRTAEENMLVVSNHDSNLLIDTSIFSQVSSVIDLQNEELKAIKEHIANHLISWYSGEEMFFIQIDNFTCYDIRVKLVNHKVFNKNNWKRRYVISEISAMKIQKLTRKSVYQQMYDVQEEVIKTYHTDSADIEI